MAVLTIVQENRKLTNVEEIRQQLAHRHQAATDQSVAPIHCNRQPDRRDRRAWPHPIPERLRSTR